VGKLTVTTNDDSEVIIDGEGTILEILGMAGALIEVASKESGVPVNDILENFTEVSEETPAKEIN